MAFQGALDISNYVDDSEDTTDTGSATSSTAGANRGVASGFPGRTASYHYSHGGNRSSGPNTASHQHSTPHYGSTQQYSDGHSRMEGGSTSKSSLTLGTSLPSNSNHPKPGMDEGGVQAAHLPPTAMTIASAEEHRKKMNALSTTIRDGSKGSSSTSILGGGGSGVSASATIVNLEENKVKIKVPGLQQKSQPQHTSVMKQKSMNP